MKRWNFMVALWGGEWVADSLNCSGVHCSEQFESLSSEFRSEIEAQKFLLFETGHQSNISCETEFQKFSNFCLRNFLRWMFYEVSGSFVLIRNVRRAKLNGIFDKVSDSRNFLHSTTGIESFDGIFFWMALEVRKLAQEVCFSVITV